MYDLRTTLLVQSTCGFASNRSPPYFQIELRRAPARTKIRIERDPSSINQIHDHWAIDRPNKVQSTTAQSPVALRAFSMTPRAGNRFS